MLRIQSYLVGAFPLIARYVGLAGVLWEVVVLKVLYHEEPNPGALLVFGSMLSTALMVQAPPPKDTHPSLPMELASQPNGKSEHSSAPSPPSQEPK